MARSIPRRHADVLIIGGGAAGVAAAHAARARGAATMLVERGPALGGELIGGLPILGAANTRGEWLIGGPARDLLDRADAMDGYVGRPFDGRTMWGACVDPEVMKLAVVEALADLGVNMLLGATVDGAVMDGDRVHGVTALAKGDPVLLTGDVIIDCSGDADVVAHAGSGVIKGDANGVLQPVSLTFRMSHVEFPKVLAFIRDNPDEFTLAENAYISKTPAECAQDIHDSGYPFAVLQAETEDSLMRNAIESGSMFPSTAIWMWPTSMVRSELGFNTTRLAGVDGTDAFALSEALATLSQQVGQAVAFLRGTVPGFSAAHLSGIAPRVGVRETRRIKGDQTLMTAEAVAGTKRDDGIAKGGHHIDVHGAGTDQRRVHIEDGRSYDIPYGALIPESLANVLVAGRCLSSEREANGSARVIGTCLAMGQAAGTAAAMAIEGHNSLVRDVSVRELRDAIRADGGVVDGTS